MSLQVAQGGLFAKLFWIWISLLISVFVFWRLRHPRWLVCRSGRNKSAEALRTPSRAIAVRDSRQRIPSLRYTHRRSEDVSSWRSHLERAA